MKIYTSSTYEKPNVFNHEDYLEVNKIFNVNILLE